MIISFAWTTHAFLTGRKTATRRLWNDQYAERFKPGMIVDAYDRSPRVGGRKIGEIKITSIFKQRLDAMTDEDEIKEGHLWGNADAFIKAMGGVSTIVWVIEFEKQRGW